MKRYNNPEMRIASFDKEAVAVTASTFQQTVDGWVSGDDGRQSASVDYQEMRNVFFNF